MDFYDVIKTRRSNRAYLDKPVPDDMLDRVLNAARNAPSAINKQPWHFVVVRDAKGRAALKEAYDKDWFQKAPVIVAACGNPNDCYYRKYDNRSFMEVDVAIALDHLVLAATAEGLGTCWIAAYKEEASHRILNIPKEVKIICLTPLGFPAPVDKPRTKRKALSEIVHWEKW